eukprot:PhF_6_TR5661/c0_g1_i1/m.8313
MNTAQYDHVLEILQDLQRKISKVEAERDHYQSLVILHTRTLEDQRAKNLILLDREREMVRTIETTLQNDLARITAENETYRREAQVDMGILVRKLAESHDEENRRSAMRTDALVREIQLSEVVMQRQQKQVTDLQQELEEELERRDTARQKSVELEVALNAVGASVAERGNGKRSTANDFFNPNLTMGRNLSHVVASTVTAGTTSTRNPQPFIPSGKTKGINSLSYNVSALRPKSAAGGTVGRATVPGYEYLRSVAHSLQQEMNDLQSEYEEAALNVTRTLDVAGLRRLSEEIEAKAMQLRAVKDEMLTLRCNGPVVPVFNTDRSVEKKVNGLHNLLRAVLRTSS